MIRNLNLLMTYFREFIKRTYRVFVAISLLNLFRFLLHYNRKSSNVIWLYSFGFRYIFSTSFLWDLATIRSLINRNQTFVLCLGNNVSRIRGKNVFFVLNSFYNLFGFSNYVSVFSYLLKEIAQNNNILIPKMFEAELWENKAFMHRQFDLVGIPCPRTIVSDRKSIQNSLVNYPCLLKLTHSYESKGVFKLNSFADLQFYINANCQVGSEFLIQELIDIRRDLRVIIIGGKVQHYYWRINNSDSWRPTATSKGNSVDFVSFPEHHRETIESYAQLLGLSICAFDICWRDDNLHSVPLVLEVSTGFSPNPKVSDQDILNNYGEFKRTISLKGYDYLYVKEIFRLKDLHLQSISEKYP